MVARENPPGLGGRDLSRLWLRLLRGWQLALSHLLPSGHRERRRIVSPVPVAVLAEALRDPAAFAANADSRRAGQVAVAGAAAVVLGATLRIGLAAATGGRFGPVVVAIAIGACWLIGRYAVFALVAAGSSGPPPTHVLTAWSIGLLPYALALSGPLTAVAFAVSAYLTFTGLRGPRADDRRAIVMCGLAYGGEAVAAFTSWAVANGLAVIPFLG